MQKGPFGYPVVDVGVTLVDGTFHAVDSSDMAFRTATRSGIGEGLAKAEPVLLEPIEHVTASVPNIFTAAAQRLLTGRRGQILGYAERPAGLDGTTSKRSCRPRSCMTSSSNCGPTRWGLATFAGASIISRKPAA
jgi:elongation factor G